MLGVGLGQHYSQARYAGDIGWQVDPGSGRFILLSAIDNLVKGAAGQAVQNMNVMFGIEEGLGLH